MVRLAIIDHETHELFVETVSDEDIEKIYPVLLQLKEACLTDNPDLEEVFRRDDAFHVAVNELGGNEMVNKISNTVRMLTHAMRHDSVKHMLEAGRVEELYRAHERIYRILKNRDEDDLERKVRSTYFVNGESLEPEIH